MALLQLDLFARTSDLLVAVNEQFGKGAEIVYLAKDARIAGLVLSPDTAKEVLARRAAERLVADPTALEDLMKRMGEKPQSWK